MTEELTEVEQRLYALIMHAIEKADGACSIAEKALNEVELIKQDMTLEFWKVGSN